MFVRTWLLHAPAAPVTEKRTLQLWACLNLRSTGSVCLGVQELYMVESNCTHAATVQALEQIVRCPSSHILMKHNFIKDKHDARSVTVLVPHRWPGCVWTFSHIGSFLVSLHVADTSECTCVTCANTREKLSFKWLWLSSPVLCFCVLLSVQYTLWPMKRLIIAC